MDLDGQPEMPSGEIQDANVAEAQQSDPTDETKATEWLTENHFPPTLIQGPPPNTEGERTVLTTALITAASQDHLPALRSLLPRISDINTPYPSIPSPSSTSSLSGLTALHAAASSNHPPALLLLLSHGAEINAPAHLPDHRTPLHCAALHGHLPTVQFLLDHGAAISTRVRSSEMTPFNYAALHIHTDVMALFLARGVDIDEAGYWGTTALHEAALRGNEKAVRMLLERGADVGHVDRGGRTALHRVAGGEFVGMARILLAEGVGVDVRDRDGVTALGFARREEMVRVLVGEGGADVSVTARAGRTVLHFRKEPGAVRFLVQSGVAVDGRADDGGTPLHEAARGLWELEAKELLEGGADVNARSNDGVTPLYEAVSYDPSTKGWLREKTVQLLLDYGANPLQTTSEGGESPLSIATARKYSKLVALLSSKKAEDTRAMNVKGNLGGRE